MIRISEQLHEKTVRAMAWMTITMAWKHDDTGVSIGNYSPELIEAIECLNELSNLEEEIDDG